VLVLADQTFPPILPAAGTEKCMVILRIENGSLHDLADEFLKQFGNRMFPAGGLILLFSATHLANVGLAAYIEDLLSVSNLLVEKLGRETRVRPLPPLLLPGCQDSDLVRDLFYLEGWVQRYFLYDDFHLEESHAAAIKILQHSGEGMQTKAGMTWSL
jgi:hypothetical protein